MKEHEFRELMREISEVRAEFLKQIVDQQHENHFIKFLERLDAIKAMILSSQKK